MQELAIYKTFEGYNFCVFRENGLKIELREIPEEIENEVTALIEYADSLQTDEEKATQAAAEYLVENVPEEQLLEYADVFQPWKEGVKYEAGKIVRDEGKLYKVIQAHTSQSDWAPDLTPALYNPIQELKEGEIADFVQPTGAHDAYQKGDKVKFEGKIYESILDTPNTWSPAEYPQGWKDLGTIEEYEANK